MENETPIEKLIEKAEAYTKTTFELCKYNTIYKSADIISSFAVRITLSAVFLLFLLFVSIGLSLWIGDCLGATFYGFFIIALCYLFFALVIYIFKNEWIKKPLSNLIINRMVKD